MPKHYFDCVVIPKCFATLNSRGDWFKNNEYIIEVDFTQNTDKMSVWGPLSPKYRQLSAWSIKGKPNYFYITLKQQHKTTK